MKNILYVMIFLLSKSVLANHHSISADTSRPLFPITGDASIRPDTSALLVIDGKEVGTLSQVKNNLQEITIERIQSVNILKWEEAILKYGKKGEHGAIEIFLKDIIVKEIKVSRDTTGDSEPRIFQKVEVEARFPGGDNTWKRYLEQTLNPMVPVDNNAPAGIYSVVIQFIVDKEGAISEAKGLTHYGYGMEQEVIRVVTKGPSWIPAMQNGRVVKAYRKQIVTFQVEPSDFEISTYRIKAGIASRIQLKSDKVKDEDMEVTIAGGTISFEGDGIYTLNVPKPGNNILTLYNKKKKKEIGQAMIWAE